MLYQSTFIYQTTSINQFFINLFYQLTFHHCFIQHFINFPYIINLLTMLLPELFTKLYCTLYLLSSFVVYFNYVILQSSNYLFIYDFFSTVYINWTVSNDAICLLSHLSNKNKIKNRANFNR